MLTTLYFFVCIYSHITLHSLSSIAGEPKWFWNSRNELGKQRETKEYQKQPSSKQNPPDVCPQARNYLITPSTPHNSWSNQAKKSLTWSPTSTLPTSLNLYTHLNRSSTSIQYPQSYSTALYVPSRLKTKCPPMSTPPQPTFDINRPPAQPFPSNSQISLLHPCLNISANCRPSPLYYPACPKANNKPLARTKSLFNPPEPQLRLAIRPNNQLSPP